jgi:superfamily I DNA and/or RNA helicase
VQDAPAVGFRVEHADPDRRGFLRETFGLHEGNEVLVHAPDGVERAFPVRGTVVETEGRDLTVDVAWEAVAERTAVERVLRRQGDGFGLTPLLNPVPFDRELDAVDAIEGTLLGAILAGQAPLTFEDDAKAASESLDDDLNQDQHRAVEHALLADRLFCIHGPPGTGKTRTLVEIVRRSVQAGRRVLVCADSNQAVDNLLVGASTADEVDEGSIHGYGQHGSEEFTVARANARRSSNDLVQAAYGGVSEASADVVAATNSSAARLHGAFDLLVLDEATQATCSSSCVPLANAEKVVLAGDHQQLPPYSATESPAASSYGLSLFEHVYAEGGVYEGVGIQLRTQYRMHRDIAYLPNRLFYDGSLRAGRTVDTLPDMPAIEAHSLGGSEESVGHSWRNPTEARLVGHLVGRLLEQGLGGEDVGVITPYSGQVREIESVLASVDGAASVVVDTIDAFQGSERAAIVISFVRSNPAGDVGFLGRSADGRRRLNVAMTRAKRHCSLVGDWHTLRGHRREEPPHECVDTYREIYRQLENTGRLRTPDPTLLPKL